MFEFQHFENASFYFDELWDIHMLMRLIITINVEINSIYREADQIENFKQLLVENQKKAREQMMPFYIGNFRNFNYDDQYLFVILSSRFLKMKLKVMTAVVTLIFGLIGKHAFDFYQKIRAGAYIEGINVKREKLSALFSGLKLCQVWKMNLHYFS